MTQTLLIDEGDLLEKLEFSIIPKKGFTIKKAEMREKHEERLPT